MDPNDQELLRVARQRVDARTGLAIHLGVYLIVNAGLIAIWWATGAHYPWFLWPLFGWGIGIASHLFAYFMGPNSAHDERAIAREMRRLRTRAHS